MSQVQLKKFTFKQIQEKVAERWEIPEYYDILMEAAVREESDGIQFNLKHASFQKLVKLVKEHDAIKKKKKEKEKEKRSLRGGHGKLKVINRSRKSHKKVKSQQQWLDILTEQLSSHSPSAKAVREACKHVGIPINLRATIWKILLNVPKKKAKLFEKHHHKNHKKHNKNSKKKKLFEPLRDDPPPLYNQRVIQADIERTRPTMKCFQDSAIRQEMEIILTEYCHRRKVSYKQGMNYVLAPFFMIEMKDRLDIYLCFESFIEMYLNSTFTSQEFGSLQCIFRMFRLLIQYHDPLLSTFLDHHEIMPELFASGWFMTIHANKCDKATLLHLWDEILLENDKCFHYFIDVEILRHNKTDILKRSQEELPQFLVNLVIDDRDYARRLLKEARKTSLNTPQSFHEMLDKCSARQIEVDSVDYLRLEKLPCLSIEPKELIGHIYAEQLLYNLNHNIDIMSIETETNQNGHSHTHAASGAVNNDINSDTATGTGADELLSTNKKYGRKVRKLLKQSTKYAQHNVNIKFFILDCRSLEEYESGHLPTAFWIDPSLEVSSEQLRDKLNSLLSMKGCHFILFFDGRHLNSDQLLLNSNDPLSQAKDSKEDVFTQQQPQPQQVRRVFEDNRDTQQLFRQSLLYFFLEKRVKYISICESGYAGCHELIVGNLELIDHQITTCIECNGKWKNSLLSSVKGRFNNLISVAGGSMEKLRNRIHNSHSHSHSHPQKQFTLDLLTTPQVHDIPSQYQSNIHLCCAEPLLMIYLSILRDRETTNADKFQDITHKVLVLMFAQIFNFHFTQNEDWNESNCVSPSDETYQSVMCQRGIYGVCLNDCCQNALQNLLHSFQPIIRSVIGTLKVEESFIEDKDGIIRSNRQCVALMPKDIDKRVVVIFHHTFSNQLHSAIDALLKLGAKQENIIIISLISSRQSLISAVHKYNKLHIWTASIDSVNSHNSSKLIPGIGIFQNRYQLKTKAITTPEQTKKNENDSAPVLEENEKNNNAENCKD